MTEKLIVDGSQKSTCIFRYKSVGWSKKGCVEFRSRLKHHHLLAEGADGGALSPMGVAGVLLSKFVDVDGVILV